MHGAMRGRPRGGPVMLLLQQRLSSKCQSVLAGPANHERTFPAEWLGSVLADQVWPVGNEGPRTFLVGTSARGLRDRG